MLTIPSDWRVWLDGIGSAIIGGAATAASSWLGMLAAKEVGLAVPSLNFKALGTILVTGGLTNLFFYLRTSPLPSSVKKQETTITVTKETTKEAE